MRPRGRGARPGRASPVTRRASLVRVSSVTSPRSRFPLPELLVHARALIALAPARAVGCRSGRGGRFGTSGRAGVPGWREPGRGLPGARGPGRARPAYGAARLLKAGVGSQSAPGPVPSGMRQ